ncbi:MAG: hypothetical protein L0Z54_02975, partial [Thermoplasmata archaeon]|nr:hypothetical protein [Thermoplasmata archaeon]
GRRRVGRWYRRDPIFLGGLPVFTLLLLFMIEVNFGIFDPDQGSGGIEPGGFIILGMMIFFLILFIVFYLEYRGMWEKLLPYDHMMTSRALERFFRAQNIRYTKSGPRRFFVRLVERYSLTESGLQVHISRTNPSGTLIAVGKDVSEKRKDVDRLRNDLDRAFLPIILVKKGKIEKRGGSQIVQGH